MSDKEGKNDYYEKGSNEVKKASTASLRRLRERGLLTLNSNRLLIVLVGLPGRGKSFIARKLQAYFSWMLISCKIFNVGKYRRAANAAHTGSKMLGSTQADFFDSKNEAAVKLRNEVAMLSLGDALTWLNEYEETPCSTNTSCSSQINKGRIAIFDATNSTQKRRESVLQECGLNTGKEFGVVFIETICDDKELLEENFRYKATKSPDYKDVPIEEALEDLRVRAQKYEEQYETISDDSLSYIKIFNLSSKLHANLIYGRMSKAVIPALMAWHVGHRPIYLCRPGQTEENKTNEIKLARCGGLDAVGLRYRDALKEFFRDEGEFFLKDMLQADSLHTLKHFQTGTSLYGGRSSVLDVFDKDRIIPGKVMCSTMPRSLETLFFGVDLPIKIEVVSNLNPLDKGDFTGYELSDIKKANPEWYSMLEKDSYNTRFPGGESYHDLIDRLQSCVIDMEQQVFPVLVVSHVSVLQVLLAYFRNTPVQQCTSLEIPMHTVIKLVPTGGGGWLETKIPLLDNTSKRPSMQNSPIWGDGS